MYVEELFVEVGIEDFDFAIPLLVLGRDLIDPELDQERCKARDAFMSSATGSMKGRSARTS